jgi:tetratricopeptide (TPR) repeat protein/transcriptional regulator with XRE-family HTH domain
VVVVGIGEEVRAARFGARLTQEQLSERSGVSVRTIVELERGQVRRPRHDTIRRLADACDLTGPDRQRFEAAARAGYRSDRRTAQDGLPAQLPPDVLGFVGRGPELAQLDRHLAHSAAEPTALAIVTLSGMAGVGKTALAVHWAHRVAERFPDGQLHLNLRGFDPRAPAMAWAEAIRVLLDGLGVAPQRIPPDRDAQVGLYRTLLAGRRILVLLDNARDAEQVRCLLPGSATSLVVITSRDDLAGLVAAEGARPLAVHVLPPESARALLDSRIEPHRSAADADAVHDILTRCAGLPLALAVVAARAATDPELSLRVIAAELHDARHRLDPLAGPDPATNIRAVFDGSYEALSGAGARLFRLLGLHPGTHIAEPAAASLAGDPPATVRAVLAELVSAHLLSRSGPDRYTLHDLLRAYAMERAADASTEVGPALRRMLDHYLRGAHAADRLIIPARDSFDIGPVPAGVTPPSFVDRADAVAWFGAERPALVAAVRQAADAGLDEHAWQLAWTALEYLDRWGHWHDQASCHEIALISANRLDDPRAQAATHRGLGRAYARLGRLDEAERHLEVAAELFAKLGIPAGEARTHLSLAGLAERRGRHRRALHHAEVALRTFRAAGRPIGEGNALNSVGWYHSLLGEHHVAIVRCEQALALLEPAGDGYGLAGTWESLGYIRHCLAEYDEAIRCYLTAIDLHRANDDRHSEAGGLTRLGETYLATGDAAGAEQCWRQALKLFEDLDDPAADRLRAAHRL